MMKKTYISPSISIVEAETVMPLAETSTGWNTEDDVPDYGGNSGNNQNEYDPHSKEQGSLWDDWE